MPVRKGQEGGRYLSADATFDKQLLIVEIPYEEGNEKIESFIEKVNRGEIENVILMTSLE